MRVPAVTVIIIVVILMRASSFLRECSSRACYGVVTTVAVLISATGFPVVPMVALAAVKSQCMITVGVISHGQKSKLTLYV
jgi:hypothetical protein